ncbi:MAG: DUF805 domain-containing protein [Desulfovibrionaceae bacterium]|nr:DUF805 domain-containing protein [Desulfovibrionaceae bacterium]
MDFVSAVKTCVITKYATFNGRASRSEFWFYTLFYWIVNTALLILGSAFSPEIANALCSVLSLALLMPTLAVGARRLHDINKSGWFLLLHLILLLGSIVLLIMACRKGTPEANRFGEPAL